MEAFIKVFNGMDDNDELFEIHQIFVEKALGFAKGQNGILLNGRIIGPFSEKETFGDDDFNLLDRFRYDEKSNIDPFWSISIQFDPSWSIRSILIHFGSFWAILVHFG